MNSLTLKNKIVIFTVILFLSLISLAGLGLKALRQASEMDNIARINQLMKSTVNIVNQFELASKNGTLNEEQAKQLATQMLRENKYHDSEYVYVVDNQLNFVATPHDPQLHGTSFNDFKDASGGSIGAMVERLVGNKTGQIITYHWDSEREGEVVDLTSVVQKTKDWGWYIGTGISYKEVDERYWQTASWLLTLSIFIAVVLSAVLAKFGLDLNKSLGGEINHVQSAVMSASRGNLKTTHAFQSVDKNSVAGAINYMQLGLQEVVGGIKNVSDALQDEVRASETRSQELDQLTNSLSKETHVVASAITELTASAATVADHAEQAAYSVKEAEEQGKSANILTKEAATTIELLEKQIENAGDNIQTLDDEVNNIESVLSVIQGIAEQTNLLALNAAIEAARAGDQGRGFAVVADEVRQLAQRTQASTEEIQQMIAKLQSATKDAKSSVTQSISTSEETVTKSQKAAEELARIAQSLSAITEMSHQISVAAKEQLQAGEDTAQRVVHISDTAENTARVSLDAHKATDQIKSFTKNLEKEIAKFEV
ncbi:methyl-accepting chemotaxis protein [Pseudoalteromonas sp. MMG024]|uniref:methyl-accepting chemotaxis protein n=1 Tax=Pseudoalteromonas sp. MMG024 TaxID=2909980 RepID=UPI001F003A0A|nr:methyl-accepting chemotaxis protein [Pseudoalteromonas sp. MMG024]MCF6457615.1 methyl-accepting chemotaxis protein [Pseudoalteromonas sp. MMG024]